MSRIFAVTAEVTILVQADDHFHAASLCNRALLDKAVGDSTDGCIEWDYPREVKRQAHLGDYGWDPMCLPYCGDGDTRLKDLLPP